jgi:putative transposase
VLRDVCLSQRERHENWLDLWRKLTQGGLRPPALVVSDGAPGLIRGIEELWLDRPSTPASQGDPTLRG